MDLINNTVLELLNKHVQILKELQRRNVIRSNNNIVGDYAEWLVCDVMCLEMATGSQKGFDAVDPKSGHRIQVKGRRITPTSPSLQLSIIREYEKNHFDYLIAVIFNEWFIVQTALLIPHSVIAKYATLNKYQNGYTLFADDRVGRDPEVLDITDQFNA